VAGDQRCQGAPAQQDGEAEHGTRLAMASPSDRSEEADEGGIQGKTKGYTHKVTLTRLVSGRITHPNAPAAAGDLPCKSRRFA